MEHHPGWAQTQTPIWRSPIFRRLATAISVLACIFATFAVFQTFASSELRLTTGAKPTPQSEVTDDPRTKARKAWEKLHAKYDYLDDNKFTSLCSVALQTYRRPKELNKTLHALLDEKIPSLLEIVVIWNDLEATPPADYTSSLGTPVRYRASTRNSLNEKLLPDSTFRTQAILLSDDDVYYHPHDLGYVFQSWRKFGRNKLTGALARCPKLDAKGNWVYTLCSNRNENSSYSMIITNLAMTHISFLDYYSSDDAVMKKIRDYVDEKFNCEDIAMNFMQSYLTGEGPLLVQGRKSYVNFSPSVGISMKQGHLKARSKCLNDFVDFFNTMPLVDEVGYLKRGVLVL
ncbi:glycosyl transferase family 64 domain-containing protein [Ilyonectria destructans]|nr:glycosyl transferase family 64 domain-containing protein [Ilyonectria destructans]